MAPRPGGRNAAAIGRRGVGFNGHRERTAMEHGLILIIEAILALDRRLQKPLREVVPELPRLREEPRGVLDTGEIIVGPRKAYAVATVLGFILSVVVLVV